MIERTEERFGLKPERLVGDATYGAAPVLNWLAEDKGIATLEAPVTGGVRRAASGEITVLVGGGEALFRTHLPAFEAMGGEVLHMGPLGSASVIKVITNMLAFIHLVAAGEALMLAKRGGLDLAQAFAAIKASSGNSFVHETESQVILNGSYNIGFTMDLACKDLGFATKMGRESGVPLDLGALAEQTFIRAREQLRAALETFERLDAAPSAERTRAELAERGIKVSYFAVWHFFEHEGISFKKKPARQRAGPAGRGA